MAEHDPVTDPRAGNRHRYSVERLYHFSCHGCGGWWSIADWPAIGVRSGALYCPHCGRHARAEPMPTEPSEVPHAPD